MYKNSNATQHTIIARN